MINIRAEIETTIKEMKAERITIIDAREKLDKLGVDLVDVSLYAVRAWNRVDKKWIVI